MKFSEFDGACERKAAGRGGSLMFFCYVNYTISTKREKQNKKTQREKWELSPLIRCNDPLESLLFFFET